MPPYSHLPGAAVPNNLLMRAAVSAASNDRPENFIGRIVAPDTQVDTFSFTAPKYNNEGLEADDSDLVGPGTDYHEIALSEGYYDESIGSHARKAVIYQEAIARAEEARNYANAVGGGGGRDQVFDLKARHTTAILQRIDRHNEVLIAALMTTAANYTLSHVFDEINVRTSAIIRETILAASTLIETDTGAPANAVFFGVGARTGAEQNATFLALLPENAPKVLTRDSLRAFLTLPETGTVMFPTARVKSKANGATRAIWDNFIWVGRVVADQDGLNETFARNYWKPDHRNRQRVYVNEISVGVQENVEIGAITHYKPAIVNKDYGVLIPTTSV
jgi:hypothetical protein